MLKSKTQIVQCRKRKFQFKTEYCALRSEIAISERNTKYFACFLMFREIPRFPIGNPSFRATSIDLSEMSRVSSSIMTKAKLLTNLKLGLLYLFSIFDWFSWIGLWCLTPLWAIFQLLLWRSVLLVEETRAPGENHHVICILE